MRRCRKRLLYCVEFPKIFGYSIWQRCGNKTSAFTNRCCSGKAISITYWSVRACERVSMRECERAWERVCVKVSGRVSLCVRVRACNLAYPACNAYAPYCDDIFGPSVSTTFLAPQYPRHFSTLSHRRCDFLKKKVTEHIMRVLIFSKLLSKPVVILRMI